MVRPRVIEGYPLIIWAILADKMEAVELLVIANADMWTFYYFQFANPAPFTPLHLARELDRSTAMLMMLEVAMELQNSDSTTRLDAAALQRAIEAKKDADAAAVQSKVAAIVEENIASELLRCGSSPELVNGAARWLFARGFTDLSKLVNVEADDLMRYGYNTADARMISAKLKQGAVPVAEMVRES
jgi:hypothetical protein